MEGLIIFATVILIIIVIIANQSKGKTNTRVESASEALINTFQSTFNKWKKIPIYKGKIPIILSQQESPLIVVPGDLYEERNIRNFYGGSVSVAKGVRVFAGQSQNLSTLQKLDSGEIVITNKRLVFVGQKRNTIIDFSKLLSIECYDNCIIIHKSGKVKSEVFYSSAINALKYFLELMANNQFIIDDEGGTLIENTQYEYGMKRLEELEVIANNENSSSELIGQSVIDFFNEIKAGKITNDRSVKAIDKFSGIVDLEDMDKSKNGLVKKYYPDGRVKRIINYVNGIRHGKLEQYYPSGTLKQISIFFNGKVEGAIEEFYEDGKLKIEGEMKNGMRSGKFYFYNEDGSYKMVTYANGIVKGETIDFYKNGNIHLKGNFINWKFDGKVEGYFEDGSLEYIASYKDGLTDGPYKTYNKDGTLDSQSIWKKGLLHGEYVEFFPNGRPHVKVNYVGGKEEGEETTFDENGNIVSKEFYHTGEKINSPKHIDLDYKIKWAYLIIGAKPYSSFEEIKKCYHEQIKKYHPDKVDGLADEFKEIAEKRTRELNEAYQILNNK